MCLCNSKLKKKTHNLVEIYLTTCAMNLVVYLRKKSCITISCYIQK
jgi:hypothetical protein